MHLCTPSISGFVFALMVLGFLWLTLPFFPFFNINLKIYHSTSYSPGFSLKRLHLKVTDSWLAVGAPEPFVAPSIFQSPEHSNEAIHPPFHSKIFLVSALCMHNLFLTYQHSFPLFGFLSSHDTLPMVFCSRSLSFSRSLSPSFSLHLPLLLQLSPLERQLFSLRPDERLQRTIKMLFKCKGVCVRVRDIFCWKWAAASW